MRAEAKAEEKRIEAARNPPPPPEPVPEPPKGIGPPKGCFRCGVEGRGRSVAVAGTCSSTCRIVTGDVKLVYPKPCGLTGW